MSCAICQHVGTDKWIASTLKAIIIILIEKKQCSIFWKKREKQIIQNDVASMPISRLSDFGLYWSIKM